MFFAVFIFSCENYTTTGIFFSIESALQIQEEDRGLSENTPINSFTNLGSHYYLTTTHLLIRVENANSSSTTGYSWREVNHPNNYPLAIKVGNDGTNVLALFATESDIPRIDLFQSNGEIAYAQARSVQWTRVSPANISSTQQVNNFFVVNGSIIVELRTFLEANPAYSYQLINLSSTPQVEILPSPDPLPFNDAEYDGQARYWFINNDKIFSSANITMANSASAYDLSAAPFTQNETALRDTRSAAPSLVFGFSGITHDSDPDRMFLVTEGSYVFMYTATNEMWTAFDNNPSSTAAAQRFEDANDNRTVFTDVTVVPSRFNGSMTKQIYASSQNEGYVLIDPTNETVQYPSRGTSNPISRSNFFDTPLFNGYINSLYYASDENVLFALTPANGLLRLAVENGFYRWYWERRPRIP